MSAVGKLDFFGDFDEQGQLVETPYRPQLAKKLIAESTVIRVKHPAPRAKVLEEVAKPAVQPPMPGPLSRKPMPADLSLDHSRDILLTAFGKATLIDRYLMPGESFQDMFARVSCAYADDVGACPAPLRRHEPALVHAGDADSLQWRHQARPADLLLPQ